VGRREELAEILKEEGNARVFVIRGIAGIGKSTLAAKACEVVRGRRNLFWHRIRPWESAQTILTSVARFLDALDRPGLGSVLRRGDVDLAAEVLRQDLPDTHSILVFDDAHEAPREAGLVLRMLTEAVASARDVKVLILTRRALSFYDVREVAIEGLIREMELGGLRAEEAASLLSDGGHSSLLAGMSRQLGGHPLFIELVRSRLPDMPGGIQDKRRFVEETIYRDLSAAERATMKGASLYRVPVPRTVLASIPGSSHEALMTLEDRSLIRPVGLERYQIHDTIRDYFNSVLTAKERRSLGGIAVGQLRDLASEAEDRGDYLCSAGYLSNALQLSPPGEDRIALLEALGNVSQAIGDLPAALSAYKEGMAQATEPETISRFHRKVAEVLLVRGYTVPASKEVAEGLRVLHDAPSVERGWLELWRGEVAWSDRRHADAAPSGYRTALKIFREMHETTGEAMALLYLGYSLIHNGGTEGDEGERLLRSGFSLATSLSNRALIAEAHSHMAHFFIAHNPDVDKALEHIAAMLSSAPDYYARACAIWWKALVQTELLADFVAARETLVDLEAIARRTYDAECNYMARHKLADVAFYLGRFSEARLQSEELWQESRARDWFGFPWAIRCLWTAAECCLWQDDHAGFERLVAELDRRGVRERLADSMAIPDVLRSMLGFIRGGCDAFESFPGRLSDERRDLKACESPYDSFSFLVPYYHGIVLRVRGLDDEAASEMSRALGILRRYAMKARLDALVRGQDRLMQTLRKWSTSARSASLGQSTRPTGRAGRSNSASKSHVAHVKAIRRG